MKKIQIWMALKKKAFLAGQKGKKVVEKTSEMGKELERMGKLGGQLFLTKAG